MATGPPRIITLLPSATEIVCLAGAEAFLVGRSHECDFPASIQHLPVLTAATNGHFTNSRDVHNQTCEALVSGKGLYSIFADLLISLKPTHIVTQSLCEVCSIDLVTVEKVVVNSQMDPKPMIISLNPYSLQDVLADIQRVGEFVGTSAEATAQVERLQQRAASLAAQAAALGPAKLPKVCFLEWTDPLFCGGHWTPALIETAGGIHPLQPCKPGEAHAGPSFVVTPEAVQAVDPDVIIIAPCGLDVPTARIEATAMAKNPWWKSLRAVQNAAVFLVDGNAHFNRPGPRLLDALQFLIGVLHERWELIPDGFAWELFSLLPDAPGAAQEVDAGEEATPPAVTQPTERSSRSSAPPSGRVPDDSTADSEAEESCFHCNPQLPPDVEECYKAAVSEKKQQYKDPLSGYQCFTELGLVTRETCCGNRCRHCPYGHFKVNPARKGPRFNLIKSAGLLLFGHAAMNRPDHACLVVCCAGEEEQLSAKVEALCDEAGGWQKNQILVLVAVDADSRKMWRAPGTVESEKDDLAGVMDWCLKHHTSMVAVPVRPWMARKAGGGLQLAVDVLAAAQLAMKDIKLKELVWVDGQDLPCMSWLPPSAGALQGGTWPEVVQALAL